MDEIDDEPKVTPHARITIEEFKDGENFNDWIEDLEGLNDYLEKHPQATATIERWGLTISSPNVDDLVGFAQYDIPSDVCCAVDGSGLSKRADRYEYSWSFC
jgi:hypothetical protein